MKCIKSVLALILLLCVLSSNVYASIDESYRMTITNDESEVAEKSIEGDIDNSDLEVVAIHLDNMAARVLYIGRLGDYMNGSLSGVDFQSIKILALYDKDNIDLGGIFVMPYDYVMESADGIDVSDLQRQARILSESGTNTATETESSYSLPGTPLALISSDLTLMYDGKQCENILLPGETLSVKAMITNNGNVTEDFTLYVAEYDVFGKLRTITKSVSLTVSAGESASCEINHEFSGTEPGTAKIFLWNANTFAPVRENVVMTIQSTDFYSNTFENAGRVVLENKLKGTINISGDVDIVKISPETSGVYSLQFNASPGMVFGIYNGNRNLIKSVSTASDKNYILCSLLANEDYYIRLDGDENNDYEITPVLPDEFAMLIKNVGTTSDLTDNTDCNVYEFTPEVSGTYIITAVDTMGVNAELYNNYFEKLGEGDTSDSNVSFRITSDMTSNQTYYIVVYPKAEADADSYTIYVEEPFTLVSVE